MLRRELSRRKDKGLKIVSLSCFGAVKTERLSCRASCQATEIYSSYIKNKFASFYCIVVETESAILFFVKLSSRLIELAVKPIGSGQLKS
jgi:hypothetical protein